MALVVNAEKVAELVQAFYTANSLSERVPAMSPIDAISLITVSHGRLMIVGEAFPTDFMVHSFDLASKDVADQHAETIARLLADLVMAGHLYLSFVEGLKGDGLSIEIVGDKVIANHLTASIGESDEQPTSSRAKVTFAEFPEELDGEELPQPTLEADVTRVPHDQLTDDESVGLPSEEPTDKS